MYCLLTRFCFKMRLVILLLVLIVCFAEASFKRKALRGRKPHERRVELRVASTSKREHPGLMTLDVRSERSGALIKRLNLRRNLNVRGISVSYVGDDGKTETKKRSHKAMKREAYYLDRDNGAAIGVKTDNNNNKTFHGTFKMGGKNMELDNTGNGSVIREMKGKLIPKNDMAATSHDSEPVLSMRTTGKRSSNPNYVVEMDFVADHTVWEEWYNREGSTAAAEEAVEFFFKNIINGMYLAYETITEENWGFTIGVGIRQLIVQKTASASVVSVPAITGSIGSNGYRDTVIDGDEIIRLLSEWRNSQYTSADVPDHVMLWTRYNLFGSSVIGYAPVSAICDNSRAISVTEDHGFHSWATAAHELGHNLGAMHDGSGVATSCLTSSSYIMSPIVAFLDTNTLDNAFQFSSCSITQLRDTLAQIGSCLLVGDISDDYVLTGDETLAGQEYTPNEQCEIMTGTEGVTLCGEVDCMVMFCTVSSTSRSCTASGLFRPAEGTPCDDGSKICSRGQCISDPTGKIPVAPPSEAGDTDNAGCKNVPNIEYTLNYPDGQKVKADCDMLADIGQCSDPGVAQNCCGSCA